MRIDEHSSPASFMRTVPPAYTAKSAAVSGPAETQAAGGSGEQLTSILNHPSLDEEGKRALAKCAIPEMIAVVTMTGNYSAATAEDRGKLLQKAYEYFGEIKDKYACADDYMPYLEACEEYDPGIERAMRGELHGLIASDPDCIQWMTNIGAVYPPPQKIDSSMLTGNFKKFDDPLIGGWNKLAEFEQPQPANAPDTAAAWRDGLNNGCLKYSRGFAGSAFDGLYNGLKNSRYV